MSRYRDVVPKSNPLKHVADVDMKDSSQQKPNTLLIACSAFDFAEEANFFVRYRLGVNSFDQILLPGGALQFSQANTSRTGRSYLLGSRVLSLLVARHNIKRVIIVSHGPNCAGYACETSNRATPSDYKATVCRDLETAKQEIWIKFGERIKVDLFYAELNPDRSAYSFFAFSSNADEPLATESQPDKNPA